MQSPIRPVSISILLAALLTTFAFLAIQPPKPLYACDDCLSRKIATTTDTVYPVQFSSTGQSMWGPGLAVQPNDVVYTIIPTITWRVAVTWPESVARSNEPALPQITLSTSGQNPVTNQTVTHASICTITDTSRTALANFGFTGSSSGLFSLQTHLHSFNSGSVDVTYPLAITVTQPISFTPGQTATIAATWQPDPTASLSTQYPTGQIDLNAIYAFAVDAGVVCPLNLCDGLLDAYLPVTIPQTTTTILSLNAQDPITISNIAGFSGRIGIPDIQTTSSLAGRHLVAQGQHQNFIDLSGDVDRWLSLHPWVPPLGFEFSRLGVDVEADLLDLTTRLYASQGQTFTFAPTVSITVQLARATTYAVRESGIVVASGVADQITFNADHQLELLVPPAGTGNFGLIGTPTFTLDNQFSNETVTTLSQDLSLEVLKLMVTVGIVNQKLTCGPIYSETWNLYTITDTHRFAGDFSPWNLGGFRSTVLDQSVYVPLVFQP